MPYSKWSDVPSAIYYFHKFSYSEEVLSNLWT